MIDDSEDLKRIRPYLVILQSGHFQIHPWPGGLAENMFEYVQINNTHLTVKLRSAPPPYHIPLAMIEFANPGVTGSQEQLAVLRLKRQMDIRGNGGGSFI